MNYGENRKEFIETFLQEVEEFPHADIIVELCDSILQRIYSVNKKQINKTLVVTDFSNIFEYLQQAKFSIFAMGEVGVYTNMDKEDITELKSIDKTGLTLKNTVVKKFLEKVEKGLE